MATSDKDVTKPDDRPELDDDAQTGAVDDRVQTDDDADDGGAPQARQTESDREETPREALVRQYRERRDAERRQQGIESEPAPADDDAPDDQPQAKTEPQAAAPSAPAAPATEPDAEPEYELKVHGRTVKMKQSDVLAQAQIALASENILRDAKEILQGARALRQNDDPENQRDGDNGTGAQDDDLSTPSQSAPANQPKAELPKEKLADIVRRLQVGDEEEGQAALADLVEITSNAGGMRPEDIERAVNRQLAQTRLQGELEQGAAKFGEDHRDIINDPELRELTFTKLRSKLREDLVKVGFKEEQLAKLSSEQLMQTHSDQRMKGKTLRNYGTIFEEVGKEMRTKFAPVLSKPDPAPSQTQRTSPTTPAPSVRISERIERKRSAPSQPRTTGVRAAAEPQNAPRTRMDIVAEMRRQRGFKG